LAEMLTIGRCDEGLVAIGSEICTDRNRDYGKQCGLILADDRVIVRTLAEFESPSDARRAMLSVVAESRHLCRTDPC
ncbi:MAG: hypothetical protein NTY66_03085, partial [Candidatus Vogelbacteria bacterium]|nr:hypothetical protein [Candidatus Vogelbacteria bacterium]